MILTCEQCESRFLLPAHTLAPDGRRVKCSNCGEVWFQRPDPEELREDSGADIEDIPEGVKPIPEGSSVPAQREPEREEEAEGTRRINEKAGYALAACVFLVSFGALLALSKPIMEMWPESTVFYKMLGMGPETIGEGLVFDKVSAIAERDQGQNAETFKVEGQIINLTRDEQSVPMVEASLRSAGSTDFERWFIALPEKTIEGEGIMPFSAQYTPQRDSTQARELNVRFVLGKPDHAPKSGEAAGDNNPAPHPAE